MKGHGTQLLMSDMAGSPTYTAIGGLVSVKPPGITRPFEDNSDHDTTGLVDKIASPLGDQTNARLRIKIDVSDPTHDHTTGLRAAARDGNIRDFRIVYTDATQEDFSGYVVALEFEDIVQGQATMMATAEILPAGISTIT